MRWGVTIQGYSGLSGLHSKGVQSGNTLCMDIGLAVDRAYRRLQQQMGFHRGSDSPHLSSLFLHPRRQPVPAVKTKAGAKNCHKQC